MYDLRGVFRTSGEVNARKYKNAVLLNQEGLPLSLRTYRPEEQIPEGSRYGCPCCYAPLTRVEEYTQLGRVKVPTHYRSARGLESHKERGCPIDHTKHDVTGQVEKILKFVSEPAEPGKRKLIYFNVPQPRRHAFAFHAAAKAPTSFHYTYSTHHDETRQFLSARSKQDVAALGIRDGAQLIRLLQHPAAHAQLIDEIDVFVSSDVAGHKIAHRFPLREIVAGNDIAGLYAQTKLRERSKLSYPSLIDIDIMPNEDGHEGVYLSDVYLQSANNHGDDYEYFQVAVIVRIEDEKVRAKVEKKLQKGGEFGVYGFAQTLSPHSLQKMHQTMEGHLGHTPIKNLHVIKIVIEQDTDVVALKRELPNRFLRNDYDFKVQPNSDEYTAE